MTAPGSYASTGSHAPRNVVAQLPVAVLVVAAGCALLTARPLLLDAVGSDHAVDLIVVVFTVLLVVGVAWPVERSEPRAPAATAVVVLAIGIAAFATGRLLGGGEAPHALVGRLILLNSLAAVAEEAFFRRLAFGALAGGGPVLAVVGSASLFAVVHVTVYGWWVLPIDLAAGLLLSWQRWAAGTWTVPAVTHVVANLFVVL